MNRGKIFMFSKIVLLIILFLELHFYIIERFGFFIFRYYLWQDKSVRLIFFFIILPIYVIILYSLLVLIELAILIKSIHDFITIGIRELLTSFEILLSQFQLRAYIYRINIKVIIFIMVYLNLV